VDPIKTHRADVNRLRHPLLRAYATVFGRALPEHSFVMTLEDLASSYRARAVELDPDDRLARGDSPSEVAARIASVRNAYRLVREVMDSRPAVWVSRWQSDAPRTEFVHVRSVSAPEVRSVAAPESGQAEWESERRAWNVRPDPSHGARSRRRSDPSRLDAIRTEPAPTARHVATVRSTQEDGVLDPATREAIYRDLMGPPRPLLGRFLVQEGLVTLSQLISAVTWQRSQRPPVGRIAMDWGILDAREVIELLRSKKARVPFCGHGVDQGALQPVQRIAILAKQRQMQRPLGEYFVEQGILSRRQVEEMVDKAKAEAR
jgi:hypothetical protein